MAKTIDISAKLTNERPKLKLAEGKEYEIDNRKNTVILMNKKMEETDLNDLDKLNEVFEIVLGEKAVKEIDEMDLSFGDLKVIFIAVMAGAMGEEYETVEARFQGGS